MDVTSQMLAFSILIVLAGKEIKVVHGYPNFLICTENVSSGGGTITSFCS